MRAQFLHLLQHPLVWSIVQDPSRSKANPLRAWGSWGAPPVDLRNGGRWGGGKLGGGEGLEGLPFKDHWELLPFCVDLSNFSFLLDFIRQNNVWAVPHGYRKPPESIGTCFETTWLYEALGTRFPTSTFQLWVQQLVLETSLFVQASLRRPFGSPNTLRLVVAKPPAVCFRQKDVSFF